MTMIKYICNRPEVNLAYYFKILNIHRYQESLIATAIREDAQFSLKPFPSVDQTDLSLIFLNHIFILKTVYFKTELRP